MPGCCGEPQGDLQERAFEIFRRGASSFELGVSAIFAQSYIFVFLDFKASKSRAERDIRMGKGERGDGQKSGPD